MLTVVSSLLVPIVNTKLIVFYSFILWEKQGFNTSALEERSI